MHSSKKKKEKKKENDSQPSSQATQTNTACVHPKHPSLQGQSHLALHVYCRSYSFTSIIAQFVISWSESEHTALIKMTIFSTFSLVMNECQLAVTDGKLCVCHNYGLPLRIIREYHRMLQKCVGGSFMIEVKAVQSKSSPLFQGILRDGNVHF